MARASEKKARRKQRLTMLSAIDSIVFDPAVDGNSEVIVGISDRRSVRYVLTFSIQ